MKRSIRLTALLLAALHVFSACGNDAVVEQTGEAVQQAAEEIKQELREEIGEVKELLIDNASIDFASSVFKHVNNGGVSGDTLPYNVDAITGATLTVEGPGIVTSIPLSVRELENRSAGQFRGIYGDSGGRFVYEGVDVYYMLHEMTDGDNGIFLTDKAYRVQLKNSNRATVAELTLADIEAAHNAGRPVLIAYGIGSTDGTVTAPFVFDAKNEGEHSLGYLDALGNDDGCLKLVYDLNQINSKTEYSTYSNVAYIYVCEETEPGFKHTASSDPVYAAPEYTDYIITFRGEQLGAELDYTVGQLESLVKTDEAGELLEGGMGYSDYYSLANNAYWYVNEYEGLKLYELLCYLGMPTREEMGRGASRTTLVTFNAADGRQSSESFSVEALSYPDAFGFYNKNAADLNDGTYVSTNADLVRTGYPILLAYGVNNYPYTLNTANEGYLSGLSNSGGPMRVVFGKTQYNHANGSNQVQKVSEIIVGTDVQFNAHAYAAEEALRALADNVLAVRVNSADGAVLRDSGMTVAEIEDVIYGEGVAGNDKAAAKVKAVYELGGGETAVLEGVDLEYLLMNAIAIPGTIGTATFSNGTESVTVSLDELFAEGCNTQSGKTGLPAILSFAKNGTPLAPSDASEGYLASIALNPVSESDPASYTVDNAGGPLMLVIPAANADGEVTVLENVTALTVDIRPDSYAHLSGEAAALAGYELRFYGEGLEKEAVYRVEDLESRQTEAVTLDFSVLNSKGTLSEQRWRGVSVYDIFAEIGIRSNAGEVTVYAADGTSVTVPLSRLKSLTNVNYVSPEKKNVCALLAYGYGDVAGEITEGTPLLEAEGGPVKLIVPMNAEDDVNSSLCVKNVVAIEVSANEITTWGHAMSDVYSEFLSSEFTLTIRSDENECSYVFTVEQLEALPSITVREHYNVLELGTCEGIDLWKFVMLFAGSVEGIENPVSVTTYAVDGYKNDVLSNVYMEGLQKGVLNDAGERVPVIIAYAFNGVPLVDTENHPGYTGLAGNTAGPLRSVVETAQGASLKYLSKLVVTLPGSGDVSFTVDESLFSAEE